jgi:hypothetical protein
MKKIISAIREIFSDDTQRLSSKRVVGVMCAIFLCITLFNNSFSEEHIAPSAILVEVVGAVIFGCLGLSSIDKFIKTKEKSTDNPE